MPFAFLVVPSLVEAGVKEGTGIPILEVRIVRNAVDDPIVCQRKVPWNYLVTKGGWSFKIGRTSLSEGLLHIHHDKVAGPSQMLDAVS